MEGPEVNAPGSTRDLRRGPPGRGGGNCTGALLKRGLGGRDW